MIVRLFAAAAVLLVAGCASAPIRYYTLTPAMAQGGGTTRPVELAVPVVPEGLQRPQLVLRRSATRLDVVETSRWTTSFDMELHAALTAGLAAELPPGEPARPPLRVATTLRQFDARPGAGVDALFEWSLGDGETRLSCTRHLSARAAGDTDALVLAMQGVVRAAAHDMAFSVLNRACPQP